MIAWGKYGGKNAVTLNSDLNLNLSCVIFKLGNFYMLDPQFPHTCKLGTIIPAS